MVTAALRRLGWWLVAMTVLAAMGPARAEAGTIVQFSSLSFERASDSPAAAEASPFLPFDPLLGTLDSVTLLLDVQLAFVVRRDIGADVTPRLFLEIQRAFDRGIATASPGVLLTFPELEAVSAIPGLPVSQEVSGEFGLSFTLNASTDAAAADGRPSPAVTSSSAGIGIAHGSLLGLREDFMGGLVYERFRFILDGFELDTQVPMSGIGNIALFYNYTSESSGSPVPEPASLLFLGTGLAGIVAARRLRRRG